MFYAGLRCTLEPLARRTQRRQNRYRSNSLSFATKEVVVSNSTRSCRFSRGQGTARRPIKRLGFKSFNQLKDYCQYLRHLYFDDSILSQPVIAIKY